MREIIT
jgi:tubulin beta